MDFSEFSDYGDYDAKHKTTDFSQKFLLEVEWLWLRSKSKILDLYYWRKVSCNREEIQ